MSAVQTMEAVSTTVSTLMVLMSVNVEVATDCPAMEGTVLVCNTDFVYMYVEIVVVCSQILMSAQ